jgi:hypothetical protein
LDSLKLIKQENKLQVIIPPNKKLLNAWLLMLLALIDIAAEE